MGCATDRGDRGSVLFVSLIAVFMVSGLIASLLTIVLKSADENVVRTAHAAAMERADAGVERVCALISGSKIIGTHLESFMPASGGTGTWTVEGDDWNVETCSVSVKSFLNTPGASVPNGLFDIYEVTAFGSANPLPGSTEPTNCAVRVIMDVPYSSSGTIGDYEPIPGACVADGGVSVAGNAYIDGADRTPGSTAGSDGVQVQANSKVTMQYAGSSAGYKSDFFAVDKNGAMELIFKGNNPKSVNGSYLYGKGSKVNFAIKVYPGGGTPYYHYAFPRSTKDTEAVWKGKDNKWNTSDDKPYCRIVQLSDTSYRLFFEDLQGSSADWDYGSGSQLVCPTADQVVDVTLAPDPVAQPDSDAEAWNLSTGLPAVAYPGEYEDFNLSSSSTQLRAMDEDENVLNGVDAYTEASVPVDAYASEFDKHADATSTANNLNNTDLGAANAMKVVSATPGSGKVTISGQQTGSGVLVVNGDLHVAGQFSYAGLIVVTGDVTITGSGNSDRILGALIAGGKVSLAGNGKILYNSAVVASALAKAGITLDDLAKLGKPTNVGTPVRRAWLPLDDAQARVELLNTAK